jgi:hypothetical protein
MEEFLKELSELSVKHGLFIHGCGCCGSPYIVTAADFDRWGWSKEGYVETKEPGDPDIKWSGIPGV